MSQQNRISITIPQEVHDAAMAKIAEIKAMLQPYLHPLTTDERSSLTKMGDKSLPFVMKTLEYSVTNPQYIAPSVDAVEWRKDFDGYQDLTPIKNQLGQLLGSVDDTVMLLGVEAYDPSRWYYELVKAAAARGDSEAKLMADDLAKRFPGVKRPKVVTA